MEGGVLSKCKLSLLLFSRVYRSTDDRKCLVIPLESFRNAVAVLGNQTFLKRVPAFLKSLPPDMKLDGMYIPASALRLFLNAKQFHDPIPISAWESLHNDVLTRLQSKSSSTVPLSDQALSTSEGTSTAIVQVPADQPVAARHSQLQPLPLLPEVLPIVCLFVFLFSRLHQ